FLHLFQYYQNTTILAVNRDSGPLEPGAATNRFHTTRWSVVLSCSDATATESSAARALSELCQTYWRPIFAFICRRGYPVPDAQDLTQDFFLMILEGTLLERADPQRGRFRSLLLKALQNFLADDAARKQ